MRYFDPKTGGHRLRLDDLMHTQEAYKEGFKAIASLLNPSLNVILSGVVITDNGTTITCTSGFAMWQGEPFEVIASSFAKSTGQLYLKLVTEVLSPSPVTYKDLTVHDVHVHRKLQLSYFVAGDNGEYLSNFSRADALGVKKGTVLDWYGNVNGEFDATGLGIGLLSGYAICNGNTFNGFQTPDLRGLFVVGATGVPAQGAPALNTGNGTYNLGDKGGMRLVKLEQAHLPKYDLNVYDPGHTHLCKSPWTFYSGADDAGNSGNEGEAVDKDTKSTDGLQSTVTNIKVNSDGGDQPHENRPPYMALVKIIKL